MNEWKKEKEHRNTHTHARTHSCAQGKAAFESQLEVQALLMTSSATSQLYFNHMNVVQPLVSICFFFFVCCCINWVKFLCLSFPPENYIKEAFQLCNVMWWLSTANLPSLILLPDDLFKVHKLKPNLKWRQAFEMYLKSMPPYFLLVRCSSFLL